MGTVADGFAAAFADNDASGNPFSPQKPAIRALGVTIETQVAAEVTRAEAAEQSLSTATGTKAAASDLTAEVNRAETAEQALGTAIGNKAAASDLSAEVTRAEQAEAALATGLAGKAAASDLTAEVNRAEAAEAAEAQARIAADAQGVSARQTIQASLQRYRAALLLPPDRPGDGPTFFGMSTSSLVISITPSNSLGTEFFLTALNAAIPNGTSEFYAAMVGYASDPGSAPSLAYRAATVPAGGLLETMFLQWLQLSTTAVNPGPGLGYSAAQSTSTLAGIRSQALATQAGTSALPADPSQFPPVDPASIAVASEGAVCRLFGAGYVSASTYFAIEPDRIYDARLAFSRSQTPADPSGDDVRFGAFLYDANKTLLGPLTLTDFPQVAVASGRQKTQSLLSRLTAPPAGVATLQATARYARPFVETFGGAQQTDIEVISWRDVTEMARLAAASGASLNAIFS